MTREEASLITQALTTYDDHDLAVGALKQAADELQCLVFSMLYEHKNPALSSAMQGLVERMRAAAGLAGAIDLCLNGDDHA